MKSALGLTRLVLPTCLALVGGNWGWQAQQQAAPAKDPEAALAENAPAPALDPALDAPAPAPAALAPALAPAPGNRTFAQHTAQASQPASQTL